MKLTDLFVRRPVLALVINIAILIAGLQAIKGLAVRQYPRSDIAVVKIATAYVGANADLVRGFITTPLERSIASADGIDYIESTSAQGLSTITVHLKLNYDVNAALTQIQAKVAQVRNDLPPEAESSQITVELADNEIAAMYIGFASDTMNASQISDYLLRVVQPRITAIAGVQRADILGNRTFAMRIWLKADKMAALGISPTTVREALTANNYLSALGRTKGSMTAVNLVANTDLKTPEEFRDLIVKQSGNTVIRLGEIADVELGSENYDDAVRFDGQTATFMGVWVLPTANSLDVIRAVREALPAIRAGLPSGLRADVAYDSTVYIDSAIHDVVKTLTETLLIVIAVIFLFLGSVRAVIIPVIAIPISLVGACLLMAMFGFTLNLLTLLAIVLSVGLVVDDAIVVVENIERHLHEGQTPFNAAIYGARELLGPIIAMTITLVVVYTPVALQGGLTGALFREFAFTLAGAVVISGIVALTLSPMLGSKLLKAGASDRGFAGVVNRRFDSVRRLYSGLLTRAMNYRPAILLVWAVVSLLAVPFFMFSMTTLAPVEDQGVVFGIVQSPADATLEQTTLFAGKIYDVFKSFPEAASIFEIINPAMGFSGMVTKPWNERKRNTEAIQAAAAMEFSKVPGVRIIPITPAPLPGGAQFPVDFVIGSTAEPKVLLEVANKLVQKAFASGVFQFADADLKYDQPQAEVVFDRDKVRAQGINLSQVGADLSTMLGGNWVNRFSNSGLSYKVIPQIKRVDRLNTDQLGDIYVTGPQGKLVPLSTFATIETTAQPRSLNRFQQMNAVRIQGVIPPGVPLDSALKVLEDEVKNSLPAGYSIDYAGQSRQLRVEGSKFLPVLMLSFVLIYLVLAAQFESFRDPLIILFGSVPLALSGSLMFTFFGFTSINIYSQVGLITLVGLVAKNAILMVEFANHLQEQGLAKLQAIIEASTTRLRPILMTTAATIVGHFPLVIATGPGAGARNSIGIVLCTGMFIGTAFTLFVVPAIYMLVAKNRKKLAPEDDLQAALTPAPVH
ncbi:MAG TPA: efflux RND transporter permease subunit [Chthoniobacterales bacterium]